MTHQILEGLPEYFEPIRHLGEGGMGVVWSVMDKRVNKIGALKVIRQKGELTEVAITRFEREIRNFAQLIHPYIVQVYDVGLMETGEPYIFMEQVNGRPICTDMLRGKPFSEIMQLIDRILEGLDEAHANNLIHRDLKPDNILVTEDEEGRLMPKLMDFGLAMRADENELRITSDGMVVGTPIYMAPEQACDEHYQICPATDFYGIGCILYELFSGNPPFTGTNAVSVMIAQAKETPKPFVPLPEFKETERLKPIIMRLLEKMPDRRYECAADIRAALRRLFLIRDNQMFGTMTLKMRDSDTTFDDKKEDNTPFFSTQLAPDSYKSILPDLDHCNYNYSVLSLRPPYFIGRRSAKYLLNRYLKDVFQCKRTAVTMVTGQPGVGKTRFLESFVQDCFKQGSANSLIVDGSVCANLRFALYRALFAKFLLKTLTPQQVPLALCRFMQTDDERDYRVRALLDIFESEQKMTSPPLDKMDAVFYDVFAKLTFTRPLILCFDNIVPDQRVELATIAREITEFPRIKLPILICVVNSTTNDMPTDLELALGNENAIWLRRSIFLTPLSNADMHSLITQSLSCSEELSGFIEKLSCGLPQIAVALARQWQLAGLLQPSQDGYISVEDVHTLPIPRVVHEHILRLLYLTFAEYPVRTWMPIAVIAAVFGDEFTPTNLASALQFIPSSLKILGHSTFISLALAGGVFKTVDESTLKFANPLMREALIASLQAYEVQDYHRAVASALLKLPRTVENVLQIAFHYKEASQFFEAFDAYLFLAKKCLHCSDFDKALEYIDEAEEALKQHFGFIDARTPELYDVWLVKTTICLEINEYEKAVQLIHCLDYAIQYIEEPEKQASYFVLKSRVASLESDDKGAARFLNEALARINALPKPLTHDQLEASFSALILQFQRDSTIGQQFIDTARGLKDAVFVGKALLAIAKHSLEAKDFVRAKRILNMTIETAHKNKDLRTEATALYLLSRIQTDAPDTRLRTLYEAMDGFEKTADYKNLATVHADIASLLASTCPDEAKLHEHWSELLCGA